ncbi:hypothetical protein [Novosphingobium sp. Fuku2-ISO-50]|uniref:hypothetical protein n=1 Tax=Novosphingobium sp. Fuku2-ISO-50 TaxID=1739114 RepID=UPI000834F6F9|nr:hypothetical protein [Novosphingobium sp. Fuku2-ISO-50]
MQVSQEEWSEDVHYMRFKPSQVQKIVGVSTDQQRLWASKGYDFRGEVPDDGVFRLWAWDGCQQLAVFAEAMTITKDFKIASALADVVLKVSGLDYREGVKQGELEGPRPDALLYWDGAGAYFGIFASIERCLSWGNTDLRPQSLVVLNFSHFQRVLAERANFGS